MILFFTFTAISTRAVNQFYIENRFSLSNVAALCAARLPFFFNLLFGHQLHFIPDTETCELFFFRKKDEFQIIYCITALSFYPKKSNQYPFYSIKTFVHNHSVELST